MSLFLLSQFQSSVQPIGTHNQLLLVPVTVLHPNQILTFILIQPKLQGQSQYCLPCLYPLSLVCSNWVVSLTQIGNYSEGMGVEKVMSETSLLPQACTASEGSPSHQSQSGLVVTSKPGPRVPLCLSISPRNACSLAEVWAYSSSIYSSKHQAQVTIRGGIVNGAGFSRIIWTTVFISLSSFRYIFHEINLDGEKN